MEHDPPEQGPVAVQAFADVEGQSVRVIFDMPLQPPSGELDRLNWTLFYDDGSGPDTMLPNGAEVTGNEVILEFESFNDPTQIEFSPPPFDVIGVNGLPAQAFVLPFNQ